MKRIRCCRMTKGRWEKRRREREEEEEEEKGMDKREQTKRI